MQRIRGSTRLLLIGVLAAAAVLLVASMALILGGTDAPGPDDTAGAEPRMVPQVGTRDRARVGDDVEGDGEEEDDDEGIVDFSTRTPEGPVFVVNAETLGKAFAARHWEEIRRQIDELQRQGGEVPVEIVEGLLALLEGEDTRIDAVLALGQIKSDAAGQALAERAADTSWPLAVRNAALEAIANNGSEVALSYVRTLVVNPLTDPALLRYAYRALGGIGGTDASRTLIDALRAHGDDELTGVLITALGKAEGSDVTLAQTLRQARDAADPELARSVVRIALLRGADAGDEMRTEIRRLLEDSASLEFVADDEARLRLKGGALTAAAAMGGELLDPVLRIAREDTDGLRGIALYSLRQARGDGSAKQLVDLLKAPTMAKYERDIIEAIGQTGSRAATSALVARLSADDVNIRQAASRALALVRDPDSVKPILERLQGEDEPHAVATNLIEALGTIGANDALPTLESILASESQWAISLRPYARRAIGRIKSGNPDSMRME